MRRAIAGVDADALDQVMGEWLLDQVRAEQINQYQLVLAVDGKSIVVDGAWMGGAGWQSAGLGQC